MYPHREPAELLAEIDSLLAQTDEIRDLAGRVLEILLRPASGGEVVRFHGLGRDRKGTHAAARTSFVR